MNPYRQAPPDGGKWRICILGGNGDLTETKQKESEKTVTTVLFQSLKYCVVFLCHNEYLLILPLTF
jgi:hypothetical protein